MNIDTDHFDKLIETGVAKLKQFGFTNVTKENILSDDVYCFFFTRFIDSLKDKSKILDGQINESAKILKFNDQ